MKADFDGLISRAKELAQAGNEDEAMVLASRLIEQYPHEMKVWSLRGYLHALSKDYDHAVTDFTSAISLNPMEPYLFYNRGRYRFELHDNENARADFSKALELCEHYHNDYYREELYFWRAEISLILGNKEACLRDLLHVRDDYTSWTYKLRTKNDLLSDCGVRSSN